MLWITATVWFCRNTHWRPVRDFHKFQRPSNLQVGAKPSFCWYMGCDINVRPSSHRGPGWSRSWRTGSRRQVFERWEAPRCGGLWLDTGPISAADLCSSGTTSPRWATVAWPASSTVCLSDMAKSRNMSWFMDCTGCLDAAPLKKNSLGWNERPPPGKLKPAARIGDTVQCQLQKQISLSWNELQNEV